MNQHSRIRTVFMFALLACALPSAPAFAAGKGDLEAGKQKSLPCQDCHGTDGNSIAPMYPRISGQYADYLARTLREYRDGSRDNPIMAQFATNLSDQDILDLAAYYAALPGKLSDLKPFMKN